jgi:hypothetical protein
VRIVLDIFFSWPKKSKALFGVSSKELLSGCRPSAIIPDWMEARRAAGLRTAALFLVPAGQLHALLIAKGPGEALPALTATTRVVWELMRAAIILYSKPEAVWRIDLAQSQVAL